MPTKNLDFYVRLPYTFVLRQDGDGDIVARVDELPGCTTHGKTPAEALDNLKEAMELWISERLDSGQPVPEPAVEEVLPSGKWLQRVPKTLHKKLVSLAKREEASLNQLVTSILAEAVGVKTAARESSQVDKEDLWPAMRFAANDSDAAIWLLPRSRSRSSVRTRCHYAAVLNSLKVEEKKASSMNREHHAHEEEEFAQ